MSDYLCEDLVIEIFTRLPPKSLVRFRSVSKSLCSHISSPSFIRLHTLRSPQKILIYHDEFNEEEGFVEIFSTLHLADQLAMYSTQEYVEAKTVVSFPFSCVRIVDSCNGILCLLTYTNCIALWNPSIRRILKVPTYPSFKSLHQRHTFCIGFCYDPIIDDYKIVVIIYTYKTGVQDTCVYNTKSGDWCRITFPTSRFEFVTTNGCFVNGSLHWIVKRHTDGHYHIMTFDVTSHVFGSIELPEPGWEAKLLMIINGSLAFIFGKGDHDWIWVRNSQSWHVDLKFKKNQLEGVMEFLQLNTNGDLLISYRERFHVYNPQKEVQSEVNVPCNAIQIKMCIESLELINQGDTVCFTEQDQQHLPPGLVIRSKNTTLQLRRHFDDLCTLRSKKPSKVCKLFSELKKFFTCRIHR